MTKLVQSSSSEESISCLVMPVQGKNLILPNISVAEVISLAEPAPIEGAPSWLLGNIEWRGEKVPMISFEAVSKSMQYRNSGSARLAVINASGEHNGLHFFAMVIQGIPRMIRITDADIETIGESRTKTELMKVKTGAGPAVIPDLLWIEKQLSPFVTSSQ